MYAKHVRVNELTSRGMFVRGGCVASTVFDEMDFLQSGVLSDEDILPFISKICQVFLKPVDTATLRAILRAIHLSGGGEVGTTRLV